jgi:hypothetical protein
MPMPPRPTTVRHVKPTSLDDVRRLNAIDALDYILEKYGLAFVLTVLVERAGMEVIRGALLRIAEIMAAPTRRES